MAVHLIEPVALDLRVPRAWPCAAHVDLTGQDCGATPAAPFRRICACRHYRDLHLCATHEDIASTLAASCRDCAGLGRWAHRCPVAVIAVPGAAGLLRGGRLLTP
jgi:hypothetical protein